MAKKITLYVRKGSENDIREALDDILSSGLVEKMTDDKGRPVSLEVKTAGEDQEILPQSRATARTPTVRKMTLAKKSTVKNGIETVTAMTQASRGEDETCLGQRIVLTDRGGGKEELARQRLQALWDLNQPRVFLRELPGQAVIEGSPCAWYPLDGTNQSSA